MGHWYEGGEVVAKKKRYVQPENAVVNLELRKQLLQDIANEMHQDKGIIFRPSELDALFQMVAINPKVRKLVNGLLPRYGNGVVVGTEEKEKEVTSES